MLAILDCIICMLDQIISDMKLALGVLSLVAVDMVILITYTAVEGGKGTLIVQRVPHKENPTPVEGVSIGFSVELRIPAGSVHE